MDTTTTTQETRSWFLAVALADWPVQRLRRDSPELRFKAVVVCQGDSRSERVAACSVEARRLGARVGMSAPDAQSLVGPGRLAVAPHRPQEDRRALERLAGRCERFSPTVALEDAPEPAALVLDASSVTPLWETADEPGEVALARAVARWASEERLDASVAVAPTIGLALAMARFAPSTWASVATGATDNHVFEPLVVPPTHATEMTARLPLDALRVEPATVVTLESLGVDTVGKLLALPRASLPARFGPLLGRRLDQLLGHAPEALRCVTTEAPLAARWEFETAVSSGAPLERTVGVLLERLAAELLRRRRGALRVLVTYEADVAPSAESHDEEVVLRLFRPTCSARELAELVALHVDGRRFRHAVRAVRVLVGAVAPIETRQRLLFDEDHRDDPHTLALLVNRLASRVGAGRVMRVEKRHSLDPRKTYAESPATDVPARSFDMGPGQTERARRLPLGMHFGGGDPVSVRVDSAGAPSAVLVGAWRRVVRSWGPERVETGWWRGRRLRRDAYWVDLDDGRRLWLSIDLGTRRWSLAGEFC